MAEFPKIFPLGVGAITVDLGNEISLSLNRKAISLASFFDTYPFPGFIEAVPAYSSVSVFYDPVETSRHAPGFKTAFDAVRSLAESALHGELETSNPEPREQLIPVDFSPAAALDLDFVAQHSGLDQAEAIDLYLSRVYHVFMLGFLPGFAYMGEVDERIAVPRRDSPRLKVPKGSVGITGRQTGVYPLESPGGWQIIGRTDIEMFTRGDATPCLVRPGDQVRFIRVD